MKKKRKIHFFWQIVKKCRFDKVLFGFVLTFLIGALIIMLVEPGIDRYYDALWYCFVGCTSIGFGDIVAVTHVGRIVTVILTLYEIGVVALLSGVVVSHYLEIIHRREKISATMFVEQLEHLTELDESELAEIQEKVRAMSLKEHMENENSR